MIAARLLLLSVILALGACTETKLYTAIFDGTAKAEKMNGDFAEQFPAINRAKVHIIVTTAKSEAEGNKSLDEWKGTADKLVKAVEGGHATAQLIHDSATQIRSGVRSKADLPKLASIALRLVPDLLALLNAAGIHLEVH